MNKIVRTIYILILTISLGCENFNVQNSKTSDQAILIHNAQIIDVNNGNLIEKQAILIDSSVIRSIGLYKDLKTLAKAENHFDAKNKYVIPGLWDMHIHIEGEDLVEDNKALLPVYVAYGITTVRDAASDLGEKVLEWRDQINQNQLFGPQIFTAGRKLEGINSIWKGDLEIANEQELQEMLDKLEEYKVDFVKITENTLPGPLFLKSVKEAEKRGFSTSGHVPIDLTIEDLVEAGFSSIEHASYLLRLGSDEQKVVEQLTSKAITKSEANTYYTSNFNQETAIRAYERLGKTAIAITPTLIGGKQLAYLDENDHAEDEFLEYLTQRFTANYQWRIDRMANDTPEQVQKRKDRYELIAKQLPYLQSAGITLLAGSDAAALNTFVYPAQSLHEELELFQDAGLTPLQILQSATINGAKFMGKSSTMASIEEEKQADLVILDSNPLLDIKSTQKIYAVVNNGQYFSRENLDAILKEAKQTKIKLDKQRTHTKIKP